MGEIDWRQIIAFSQKELSPKKKEKLYESIAWMDADDIEINFGDLKSLYLIAQDMMKFKADQVDTLMGQIDAMVRRETYNDKGDAIMMEQIGQQEEEIRANKDILDQLYRDIASLQEHKDKKLNFDKESTSSKDPLSELNDIKQLEMTISLKNEHLKKMLADLQMTEEENVKLREKLNNIREKLSEATTHISHMTDEVEKLKSQSSQLKGAISSIDRTAKITELEEQKNTSLLDIEGLKQDLRECVASKNATIEELKLNIDYWKDSSNEKQTKIDQMFEDISSLKTQLKCLKDDTYLAQTVKKYKHQIKNLQANLAEASQGIDNSANVIEKLKLENKDMMEAVKNRTSKSDTTSLPPFTQDLRMTKVKQKLQCKLADAREMIRSREQEIADLSGQIQIFHRDDGIKSLSDNLHQQKRQLKIRDEHIKSLVSEINSMNEAIDNLQLENVAMREKLNLQQGEKVSTVGILAKFSQIEKRATIAERELSELKESHLTLQLETREGRRRRGGRQDKLLSGLDGGGDAPSYLSLPQESISATDSVSRNHSIKTQNLIDENEGLRKGLHEILDYIKDSVVAGKSTVDIGSESLEKVTATLDARHAAGWHAPHLATAARLQQALGARDALSSALGSLRRETYEVIEKLAKETQKTCDLENKLLELQKDKVQLQLNNLEPSHEEIKNTVFENWMTEDVFNEINLEENNTVQEVMLKTVNKNYTLQLRDALTHFHNQFNSLYKQMTDLSVRISEEQQKWGLLDEQYKAQIENLQSKVATFDNEQNSDSSIGVVQFSKVVLQRRCTYLEESFRNIRTMNENLKNEYLASEKDKLIEIGNYESQIQSLIINITSYSDRLRNSVPIDFFLKQNIKYNELNMKYRNLLHIKMQSSDITQKKNDSNEASLCTKLEAIKKEKKQVVELLRSESQQNVHYATDKESPNKQIKKMASKLATAECRDPELEQEVCQHTCRVAEQCERDQHQEQANQEKEGASKYTQELVKKIAEFHDRQKDFVDRALSCISREEYNDLKLQLEERTDDNKTLKMEIAKVTTKLEITTLQLHDLRQRQFCSDTEVSLLRHQVLDLQARDPGASVVARLGGEVLVSQLRAADMQGRLERSLCELRHEKRRRRQAEERRTSQDTSAQMHAATYHFRLGFINEVLQTLREQYDGALPLVSIENFVVKLNEMTARCQELETVQKELEGLKVTCQAKIDGYNKIISAAKCGFKENDCPHYIQLMLNKRVCAREVEHSQQQVQNLQESRAALAVHCGRLEQTLLTLSRAWTSRQREELQLLDITSLSPIHQHVSLHNETQILATPRISSRLNGAGEGTEEESMASPHSLDTQTVQIVHNEKVATCIKTHANVQTEQMQFKSSVTQTENKMAQQRSEKDMMKINSLSLTLAEKEQELKNIVTKSEREKVNWQREVETLTHRDNEKKQYIEKLVQQINNLNNQISHLQSMEVKLQQKIAAIKDAEKEKENIMDECREMLKKEREEYTSNAAASQKKIEELQTDIDKLIIESNELRGALLQPTNLKAMSDIVDKYTSKIGSLEDSCAKLQDTLDTCKSDLVWSQAEAERWKTLSMERLKKMEKLNAKLEERHGLEIEWHRAENSHLLQELRKSEHTLSELRQSSTHQRHDKLHSELKLESPPPESNPKLDETSEVESPLCSVREDPVAESHGEHLNQRNTPDKTRKVLLTPAGDSGSKSVRVAKQPVPVQGASSGASRQRQSQGVPRYAQAETHHPPPSYQRAPLAAAGGSHTNTSLQGQRRSASAAHVAMWEKWKTCERSAESWRGKYVVQQQQVKVLQARLTSARTVVRRLQQEKRLLLDRDRDDRITSDTISTSRDRLVGPEASDREASSESYYGAPHMSPDTLLARVQAQQRRIAALELASKGNETLMMEYERLLAQNTQLKKMNLKLESQVLETQLFSGSTGSTTATALKDDTEMKHLRSYVEMLKVENADLRMGVGCVGCGGCATSARTAVTDFGGARLEDLQRTVLTLRGLVAKLQAENKHLLLQKRNRSELHSPAEKDEVAGEDLLRTENGNLKKSLLEKESLLGRSGDVLRRAARREGELLQQISILQNMLEISHQTTSQDTTVVR